MKKLFSLLLVLIVLALIVFGAYKFYFSFIAKKDNAEQPSSSSSQSVEASEEPKTASPASPSPASPSPAAQQPAQAEIKPEGGQSETADDHKADAAIPSRNETATLSVMLEGTNEEFGARLFTSDFGTPEKGTVYSFYYDDSRFAVSRSDGTDIFQTDSGAKMEISLYKNTTGEALSPSFLDSYIDFTDIEFEGNSSIGGTGMRGFIINASNASKNVRAYLINHEGDVIAFVMTFTDEMYEGYLPRMIAMMNTLEINS